MIVSEVRVEGVIGIVTGLALSNEQRGIVAEVDIFSLPPNPTGSPA